tara:strand:+ start:381 stop:731 length:351 start_codon:yes stop_codon:yes gene_type:complete
MVDYFILFWAASLIAIINMIWFDSTAFEEYAELLLADKFFKVKDFKKAQQKDFTLTYHNYLLLKRSSFFIRLITCQLCFTIWLSVIACLHIGFMYLPFLTILSYTIYGGVIKINER